MSAQPLLLDFHAQPRRGGWVGAIVLLLGAVGMVLVGLQFHTQDMQRQGVELRLEALQAARNRAMGTSAPASMEEAGPVVTALGAPWSLLLQELESASHDESGAVAILAIEPDKEKGHIRIVAEARDLKTALAYIQRLQKSHALRFPMLESHEVRTDDKDQPVRFQLSADWKATT